MSFVTKKNIPRFPSLYSSCILYMLLKVVVPEEESESEVEMDSGDEDEIPLEMEDIEAVSKKARQDEDLNTEHLQVQS